MAEGKHEAAEGWLTQSQHGKELAKHDDSEMPAFEFHRRLKEAYMVGYEQGGDAKLDKLFRWFRDAMEL